MCNKMSDVRLSNASPTLERVDARQPDHSKPSVCRNLFGTADREETMREARAAVRDNEQAFVDRWNFDPAADRPLSPGNYEWVVDSAPEFYYRPPHTRRTADLNGNDEHRQDDERSDRSDNGPRKRPAGATGGCSSECHTKRLRPDDDDEDDDDEDDEEEEEEEDQSQPAASVERTASS